MKTIFTRFWRRDFEPEEWLPLLIGSGWAITLSYFPSGFLHFYLPSAVYLRDLFLAAHLIACLVWLSKDNSLGWMLRQSSVLALTPLMLLPAVADHDFRFEALRTVKWSFSWFDWMILGFLAYRNRRWEGWLTLLIGATLLELLGEWAVGFYEWRVGHYVFTTASKWEDVTLFGVQEVKELMLKGAIRVRGLQRDVFSFANLMAMSSVLGLAGASITRNAAGKIAGFAWAFMFAIMLVVSGGRSALFGILAASLLAIAFSVDRAFARRWSNVYVGAWVAIGLLISVVGVGKLTDLVSGAAFGKSHIGDSTSAYMRDEAWQSMFAAVGSAPIILVLGGPIASMLDGSIAPMFHWTDNQFLWNIYHLGVAGALGSAVFFVNILRTANPEEGRRAEDCVHFFLLLVLGEAIARESLTFMGCMPLFVACGYVSAQTYAGIKRQASGGGSARSQRVRRARRASMSKST